MLAATYRVDDRKHVAMLAEFVEATAPIDQGGTEDFRVPQMFWLAEIFASADFFRELIRIADNRPSAIVGGLGVTR